VFWGKTLCKRTAKAMLPLPDLKERYAAA